MRKWDHSVATEVAVSNRKWTFFSRLARYFRYLRSCLWLLCLGCSMATLNAQRPARPMNPELMAQLHEAILAAEHGDDNRALTLARQLLEQHPTFEPALKFQGTLLEDLGRGPEASASFQAALKLAPTDPKLLLKVGHYQMEAGDNDDAITLFVRALKYAPRDRDTLYYLAQAYHFNGDNTLALKTIQRCLKVDPDNASVWQKYGELLYSSGDNETALHWLLKAQQSDPTLERIDFDLGVASYKNMALDKALTYATKAAQRTPGDLTVQALLAAVDVKLGKFQDAEPVFRSILQLKADDAASLLGLGYCELELKHYQQAANLLEQVLRQDPTQVLAHFYLSRAYAALGRTADAQYEADLHRQMLEQVSNTGLQADGGYEKKTWDQAHELLAQNKEAEALKLFREQSKGPSATPAGSYVSLGMLYIFANRPNDADRCLRKALTINPNVRGARLSLGLLALQQSDLDKAESEFKAELATYPNDQAAEAELGEVRYRQGNWSEAADLLSKSKTTVLTQLYMLCDADFHLSRVREAELTAELLFVYAKNQPRVKQGVIDLLQRNQQTELAERLKNKQPY
jgi:tetratricopeptide (TPR) repeat protein